MSSLLKDCQTLFNFNNLYKIFNIPNRADAATVKKAYYKLSLMVHPDRATGDKDLATRKFQVLGKIYSILSDKDRRKIYDETGSVDDEAFPDDGRDWVAYWRLFFREIEEKDIESFEATYRNSAEELADLKTAYLSSKGDMDTILDSLMCSTVDDVPRYREMIGRLINEGKLIRFERFFNEKPEKQRARKRKAEKERKEAEQAAEELEMKKQKTANNAESSRDLVSLTTLIQSQRQATAEDFLDRLAAKYVTKGKGKRTSADDGKENGVRTSARGKTGSPSDANGIEGTSASRGNKSASGLGVKSSSKKSISGEGAKGSSKKAAG